ncbi:hypothetical protein [Neisseria polysaccharea]|uniref:hypothetical protein n=1 Tax=Neisseria polysaccharea TaxID=489 RepID=UPI00272B7BA5|nr:hypothetical protein [Neisseria polysaccharea]
MRFKAEYARSKNDADDKRENAHIANGAIGKMAAVYDGYTYTQPVGESTRFRGGLERVQVKRYLGEKCCGYACPKSERLTLQADGEIRQNLGEGWFLKP